MTKAGSFSAMLLPILLMTLHAIPSSATPPDMFSSSMVMLGGTDSTLVFLVSTGFNHGSHYLWETRWFVLEMDLTDFSFHWYPQGSFMHAMEDYGGISSSADESALPIPVILAELGADRAWQFKGAPGFDSGRPGIQYCVVDSSLCARYGEGIYILQGARCFDPGGLAVLGTDSEPYYITDSGSPVREIDSFAELPRFWELDESRPLPLEITAWAPAGSLSVMVARVPDEMSSFDVIVSLPERELRVAADSLFRLPEN